MPTRVTVPWFDAVDLQVPMRSHYVLEVLDQYNLAGVTDWTTQHVFVDVFKYSQSHRRFYAMFQEISGCLKSYALIMFDNLNIGIFLLCLSSLLVFSLLLEQRGLS